MEREDHSFELVRVFSPLWAISALADCSPTLSSVNKTPVTGSRFQPRQDLRTLAEVVAEVARAVDPDAPARVLQREWDAARANVGYPDVPRAAQIARRFQLPWAELLELVLQGHNLDQSIGRLYGEEDDPLLGEAAIRTALKTVALRLGKKTLRPAEYREERQRMLDKARLSWLHGVEPVVPSEGQVIRVAGSWDQALEIAGLALRPPDPGGQKGMAIVDALELCLETFGCLPTSHELERFGKTNGISLARRNERWGFYLTALRQRRQDWGRWTPASPPPLNQRPDYTKPVPGLAVAEPPRRRKMRWTKQECVDALVRLMVERPGQKLTQRAYQSASRGRDDLPSLSSLQEHDSFSALVAAARKRVGTSQT